MNLLLTMMKRWPSALASLLLLCLMAAPAVAGEWVLDGYYWSGSSDSINLSWGQDYYSTGEYETSTQKSHRVARGKSDRELEDGMPPSSAEIVTSGLGLSGKYVTKKGVAEATAEVGSSVYARFNWRRNQLWSYDEVTGEESQYPDSNDNPPSYVYVRETGSVSAGTNIRQRHGNPTLYSNLNRWQGDYYEIKGEVMGVNLGGASRPEYDSANSWKYGPNSKSEIRKVAVSGDSVTVPSRSFSGEIKLSPGYEYEKETFDQITSGRLSFDYSADSLNFLLHASAPTVAHRQQTFDAEEVDALVGLSWIYPNQLQTNDDGQVHAVPDRAGVLLDWKNFLGDGDIDDQAPLPYFEGVATFNLTAKNSDGRTSIYSSPTYTWTPEGTTTETEAFAVPGGEPQVTVTNDLQRTYAWNFGTATDDSVSFPQSTSVSVEMKSDNPDEPDTFTAEAKINWHTTWTPTETGLQKNVVTSQHGQYVLPDGSPIAISDVKPGDTFMCFVSGEPGFSTDGGRLEKIRPVDFVNQVPGPGERIEPRIVGKIEPTDDENQIIIFKSTPQVNPDDNPDEAGHDDIQQAQEIAAASEQAYQTGKAAVTGVLEIQLEIMKAAAFGPAEGVAMAVAVKGLSAVGRLAEAAKTLRATIKTSEEAATDARKAAKLLEATKARGGLSAKRLTEVEKKIKHWNGVAGRNEQVVKDSTSALKVGEKYAAEAAAKLKKGGCFVAGTPVWMADGTLKLIEQVKVGDSVLSKNEQTGEITPKKVTNTSVRPDIWTRKLTFEKGSVLETTDEHPLYVGGRGFVKAQEVGIGSSIVTRAGPSAKVITVEADVRQATVYNFTVDEFHTYFVGQDALWVHNQTCPQAQAQPVDPSFTRLDQDFAKHMYEGDLEDASSLYSGEWSGGGLHQWEAMERRFVNANNDTVYAIVKVREDPVTLARSVDVERITQLSSGRLNPAGTVAKGKTLWPKGMGQQEINGVSNQAFSDALNYNGINGNSFSDISALRGKFSGMGIAPNGSLMPVEGYYKIVTTGGTTTRTPISCWPQGGSAWPVIPHTAY